MLATRPRVRHPRTSGQTVRRLLLEIAYQVHATRAVRPAPARDRRRPGGAMPTA